MSEQVRAAQELGQLGPLAQSAVPLLLQALDAKPIALQHEAVIALAMGAEHSPDAVSALKKALHDENAAVRRTASQAVQSLRD